VLSWQFRHREEKEMHLPHVLISDGQEPVKPDVTTLGWILDHSLFMGCVFYTLPVLVFAFIVMIIMGV
jgi:hypothetical protein